MIGKRTASLESPPRRWLQRVWGCPDIHARQKWMLLWPQLSSLPQGPLRVLDAGCGPGPWTLELAARRPGWSVVGLDRDETLIEAAERSRQRLALDNARFIRSDFLDFAPAEKFDVVLSVSSAHYLVERGHGEDLFTKFRLWLKPGGLLLLFAPRIGHEVPLTSFLPSFFVRDVFSLDLLQSLCLGSELLVEALVPCIGRPATMAKQLACLTSRMPALKPIAYPFEVGLTHSDSWRVSNKSRSSSAWLLVARKPGAPMFGSLNALAATGGIGK